MAIIVNDGFENRSNKPLLTFYLNGTSAWTSVAAAQTGIPISYRHVGMTVLVGVAGVVEYWWEFGIADGQLVRKGPSQVLALEHWDVSSQGVTIQPSATGSRRVVVHRSNMEGVPPPAPLQIALPNGFVAKEGDIQEFYFLYATASFNVHDTQSGSVLSGWSLPVGTYMRYIYSYAKSCWVPGWDYGLLQYGSAQSYRHDTSGRAGTVQTINGLISGSAISAGTGYQGDPYIINSTGGGGDVTQAGNNNFTGTNTLGSTGSLTVNSLDSIIKVGPGMLRFTSGGQLDIEADTTINVFGDAKENFRYAINAPGLGEDNAFSGTNTFMGLSWGAVATPTFLISPTFTSGNSTYGGINTAEGSALFEGVVTFSNFVMLNGNTTLETGRIFNVTGGSQFMLSAGSTMSVASTFAFLADGSATNFRLALGAGVGNVQEASANNFTGPNSWSGTSRFTGTTTFDYDVVFDTSSTVVIKEPSSLTMEGSTLIFDATSLLQITTGFDFDTPDSATNFRTALGVGTGNGDVTQAGPNTFTGQNQFHGLVFFTGGIFVENGNIHFDEGTGWSFDTVVCRDTNADALNVAKLAGANTFTGSNYFSNDTNLEYAYIASARVPVLVIDGGSFSIQGESTFFFSNEAVIDPASKPLFRAALEVPALNGTNVFTGANSFSAAHTVLFYGDVAASTNVRVGDFIIGPDYEQDPANYSGGINPDNGAGYFAGLSLSGASSFFYHAGNDVIIGDPSVWCNALGAAGLSTDNTFSGQTTYTNTASFIFDPAAAAAFRYAADVAVALPQITTDVNFRVELYGSNTMSTCVVEFDFATQTTIRLQDIDVIKVGDIWEVCQVGIGAGVVEGITTVGGQVVTLQFPAGQGPRTASQFATLTIRCRAVGTGIGEFATATLLVTGGVP